MQIEEGGVPKLESTNHVEEMESSQCEVVENNLPQEIGLEAGPLVQKYCKLASNISTDQAPSLIKEVLEAPGLYVFAEILYMPNIREVSIFVNNYYHEYLKK